MPLKSKKVFVDGLRPTLLGRLGRLNSALHLGNDWQDMKLVFSLLIKVMCITVTLCYVKVNTIPNIKQTI